MASFKIYKALPLEIYQNMLQVSREPLEKVEQLHQPVLPSTTVHPNPSDLHPDPIGLTDHSHPDPIGLTDHSGTEQDRTATIISLLPQRQQERSKKILEVLQRCQISWDALGQLTDGKNSIPESNIVDLLNFLTCTIRPRNAHLTGLGEMVSALRKYNAPLCLFGKEGKKALTMEPDMKTPKTIPGWTSCEKFKLFKQ